MKRLLAGSIGLVWVATGSAALAADLTAKPVYKATPTPMVADPWSGFYVGINGGGSVGRDHTFDQTPIPGLPLTADFRHAPIGAVFGVQAGWNWHVMPSWVIGAEADWQWSGQKDSVCTYACLPDGPPPSLLSITDEQSLKWFGTARGRIGWLSPGGSLWYGTGGAAWGRVNQTLTLAATPGVFLGANSSSASFDSDKLGWTIGAGVEMPFWDKWSLKAEYLYVNLGRTNNSFSSTTDPALAALFVPPLTSFATASSSSIQDHIFRFGVNYHLGADVVPASAAPVYTKAPAPQGPGWNGFYGGVNAGLAIARNPTVDPLLALPAVPGGFPVLGADSFQHAPFGGLFGAQLGFNWRLAPSWVLGAEVDGQWSRQTDIACISDCLPTGVPGIPGVAAGTLQGLTDSQTLSRLATARGRFGWVAPNGSLWYVTGGAAWGRIESQLTLIATPGVIAVGAPSSATFTHNRLGWTVGAGAEIPLWSRWSLKAEYLYVDLGSATDTFATAADVVQLPVTSLVTSSSYSIHDHIARMGVNYHF